MARSDRTAAALERGCLDAVEAAVLAHRVGEEFEAVVVDVDEDGGGEVQVIEPVALAACGGRLTLGERVRVRLETADPDSGTVRFAAVGGRQSEAIR
jgi:exoribonuclease R